MKPDIEKIIQVMISLLEEQEKVKITTKISLPYFRRSMRPSSRSERKSAVRKLNMRESIIV